MFVNLISPRSAGFPSNFAAGILFVCIFYELRFRELPPIAALFLLFITELIVIVANARGNPLPFRSLHFFSNQFVQGLCIRLDFR